MSGTSTCLPIEVIGRIMLYVSHPCSDLIRNIGLIHEYTAWNVVYDSNNNPVGPDEACTWIWTHRNARLRMVEDLRPFSRAYNLRQGILKAISYERYRYVTWTDHDEDDDDEDDGDY